MEELYGKSSLKVCICPNACGNLVRNTVGVPERLIVPCGNIDPDSLSATFTRRMLVGLNGATRGAISNAGLMEQANRAMGAGIEPGDTFDLFRCFVKLGMAVGRQPEQSIQDGVYGILNKSRKRLDNLGIYVYARDAYAAYPELDRDAAWNRYVLETAREAAAK